MGQQDNGTHTNKDTPCPSLIDGLTDGGIGKMLRVWKGAVTTDTTAEKLTHTQERDAGENYPTESQQKS